jgi:hypothetical protein
MVIWSFCLKRSALEARARIPLETETDNDNLA